MLSNTFNKTPLWFIVVFITLLAILIVIYMPFQIHVFDETDVKKIYYVDNISPAHQLLISRFNEMYRGSIEVVPVNLPFHQFTTNDRKEILTRSLRSRSDAIDVFAVDLIWIPRFAKWAYPLNQLISSDVLPTINSNALSVCYQDDKLVAFPLFLDIGILYYRCDILCTIPGGKEFERKLVNGMTWDDFIAFGRKWWRRTQAPFYIFAGGEYEGMICSFYDMVPEYEYLSMFTAGEVNLYTPRARRALQHLVDCIHKHRFTPIEVTTFDEFASYLYANEHNVLFLRGWVGFHKQYKMFLKDTSHLKYFEIAPLPHFQGCNTSTVFGGWSLMISKHSNRVEEALKFIQFMYEKESQEILYNYGGYLPVNMAVYSDSVYIRRHPELKKLLCFMAWGHHRPMLENYTRISEIMAHTFHRALKNEFSVDTALIRATHQINEERVLLRSEKEEVP
ncbi:MAG: extracellular solute-binding protein [Bacteroidetes bacterium]|nr:extracellular solute-binding protein [Bacteroidota bacterium]